MALIMAVTLRPPLALGFSESARWPVPGHDDAAGHAGPHGGPGRGLLALAVLAGRDADDLVEGPAERAQRGEADVEADLGHRGVRAPQLPHRALDPAALEVAVRRLS